jgi:glycerate kinase
VKFVFAPDSFKGSISALNAARMLDQAARRHFAPLETVLVPVADGGEGTVDALILATGGQYRTVRVTGPLGEAVDAAYGLLPDGQTAVLEMAQASGLPLVPPDQRNPLLTSSYGTGEMMLDAIAAGAQKLLIGIGGSATNDGGMGMLSALGWRFLDADKAPVKPCGAGLAQVAFVDGSQQNPALAKVSITVICDVNNPLLGSEGATRVYGPQKGADAAMLETLEVGMGHYARKMAEALGHDIAAMAGAGAAGGMGAALAGVLGATLRSGIDAILDAVQFDTILEDADLVVTGEGRMDGQSIRFRKVPAGVALRCGKKGVPLAALVGGMAEGSEALYDLADASILTTINAAMPIEEAMANANALFEDAADRMFRMLAIGSRLGRKG